MKSGWHWMMESEESLSPEGPDVSPAAADPSACLTQDTAREGKCAKSTEMKDITTKEKLMEIRF